MNPDAAPFVPTAPVPPSAAPGGGCGGGGAEGTGRRRGRRRRGRQTGPRQRDDVHQNKGGGCDNKEGERATDGDGGVRYRDGGTAEESNHTQPAQQGKHDARHRQWRRRRRQPGSKRDGAGNDDTVRLGAAPCQEGKAVGEGNHRGGKKANTGHRKHKGKRRGGRPKIMAGEPREAGSSTVNADRDRGDIGLDVNEGGFPSLAVPIDVPAKNIARRTGNALWNKDSLASKLASALEMERRQQKLEEERQRMEREADRAVRLTTLTSRSSHGGEQEIGHSLGAKDGQPRSSVEPDTNAQNEPQPSIVLNAKSKSSGAEVSRMRERWWIAVKTRRRERKEDAWQRQEDEDGSTSSASESSSSSLPSTSSSSSDEESLGHYDPMQPPSLNRPFDEVPGFVSHSGGPESPKDSTSIPDGVGSSIVDLEERCLRSSCPLHCAVYNVALSRDGGAASGDFYGDHGSEGNSAPSEAEVVLRRLLTMQDASDVLRWKCQRVGLVDVLELEASSQCEASRADAALTDAPGELFSAETTALSPLQLAIYWNLPGTVRVLGSAAAWPASKYGSKGVEEEDDSGRTPLMVACELGRAACIQALLCASSPKLDRRERIGGNTAFHFCCMGRSNAEEEAEEALDCDVTACVEAIDMLLRYTPPAVQKRALMMSNCRGQNLYHLACSRGELALVERLLDQRDAPGVKISKALDAKDKCGHTPFLAAVAADACAVVMHLLTTRLGPSSDYSSWFAGRPLVVAASNGSVEMVSLLLGVAYNTSGPYGSMRKAPEMDVTSGDEVNRALLEVMYQMTKDHEDAERTYEIIRLLISEGRANPHLPVTVQFPGKPPTRGDRSALMSSSKGKASQEDTPLLAAVRAPDVKALRCMIDAYSNVLEETKSLRRNDPLLRSQPESYFRLLEDKEEDAVHSSVDAALVSSLFLLWHDTSICADDYGRCALVLYKRGRSNLSFEDPRKLSQRAIQWLEKCTLASRLVPSPMMKDNSMEGFIFEAPIAHFGLSKALQKGSAEKVPYRGAASNFMDWSHVMASLPWFRSHSNGVNCSAIRNMTLDRHNCDLSKDEFFIVVGGESLLAHKSIVSARSGKLAAHIRFSEAGAQEGPLSIHVDLPLLVAQMLLSHCYHGSIAFGLKKSPTQQCRQLLEMALVAEEYLCPSLLLECEIRLLAQTPPHLSTSLCICPQCCGEDITPYEQLSCPIQRQCLENSKKDLKDDLALYCEPVGVYAYKTSTFIMSSSQSCLISPDTAIDIIAVAQQLERSSSCEEGFYALKYCQSHSADDPLPAFGCWNIDTEKDTSAGCIPTPFAAAKMMAIWTMLRDFPAVIESDSYLRQIQSDDDDGFDGDGSFGRETPVESDDNAILLLRTCLDELACSPFHKT